MNLDISLLLFLRNWANAFSVWSHRLVYKPKLFVVIVFIAIVQTWGAFKTGQLTVESLPDRIRYRDRKSHRRDFGLSAAFLGITTLAVGVFNDGILRDADTEQLTLKTAMAQTNTVLTTQVVPVLLAQKQSQTAQIQNSESLTANESASTPQHLEQNKEALKKTDSALAALVSMLSAQNVLLQSLKTPSAQTITSVVATPSIQPAPQPSPSTLHQPALSTIPRCPVDSRWVMQPKRTVPSISFADMQNSDLVILLQNCSAALNWIHTSDMSARSMYFHLFRFGSVDQMESQMPEYAKNIGDIDERDRRQYQSYRTAFVPVRLEALSRLKLPPNLQAEDQRAFEKADRIANTLPDPPKLSSTGILGTGGQDFGSIAGYLYRLSEQLEKVTK